MKRKNLIPTLVNLAGVPLLLIAVGLILVINPDSASALVCGILGWGLILFAIVKGLAALLGDPDTRVSRGIGAVIILLIGTWLVRNPLLLARGVGKLLGILLMLRGIGGFMDTLKIKNAGGSYLFGLLIHSATVLAGIWLLFSPLAPTRILISVVGIVFIMIGLINLFSAKDQVRFLLNQGSDPNIIDADD